MTAQPYPYPRESNGCPLRTSRAGQPQARGSYASRWSAAPCSRVARLVGCSVAIGSAILLGACSGIHLYDANNDALAQDAKIEFGKADLPSVVATQRRNLAAFHEQDIVNSDRFARNRRDTAIVEVINTPTIVHLQGLVDTREQALGVTADTARALQVARIQVNDHEERLLSSAMSF